MEKNQILARPAELFIKHYYIIEGKIATYYLHFTGNEQLYFLHRLKQFGSCTLQIILAKKTIYSL